MTNNENDKSIAKITSSPKNLGCTSSLSDTLVIFIIGSMNVMVISLIKRKTILKPFFSTTNISCLGTTACNFLSDKCYWHHCFHD